MNLLEQPQVVCTINLWYHYFFRGHFRVGVYCIVSQENLKYVCTSGNIFVNTQSILKILAPKRKALMMNIHIETHYYNI